MKRLGLSYLFLYVFALPSIELYSKRRNSEEDLQPEKDFQTLGRMYGRQDDPFMKIDAIVNFGLKYETAEEEEENLEERQEHPQYGFCHHSSQC